MLPSQALKTDRLVFFWTQMPCNFIFGDITGVTITTSGTSGLAGGAAATSGAFASTLTIAPNSATSATVAGGDIVLIGDADDSNNLKKTTAQEIANLGDFADIGLVIALG